MKRGRGAICGVIFEYMDSCCGMPGVRSFLDAERKLDCVRDQIWCARRARTPAASSSRLDRTIDRSESRLFDGYGFAQMSINLLISEFNPRTLCRPVERDGRQLNEDQGGKGDQTIGPFGFVLSSLPGTSIERSIRFSRNAPLGSRDVRFLSIIIIVVLLAVRSFGQT